MVQSARHDEFRTAVWLKCLGCDYAYGGMGSKEEAVLRMDDCWWGGCKGMKECTPPQPSGGLCRELFARCGRGASGAFLDFCVCDVDLSVGRLLVLDPT